MNKEEPYRDQAERLKQRIEKINEKNEVGNSLPPREQLHRQKQPKTKWKLKFPVIRLLVLIFILLPIISFSVISYLHGKKIAVGDKVTGNSEPAGVETINLEKNNSSSKSAANQKNNGGNDTTSGSSDSTTQTSQPNPGENVSVPKTEAVVDHLIGNGTDNKNSLPQPVTNSSKTNTSTNTKKIVYHTVKLHETLYRIAIEYYHSQTGMDILKKENHLKDDQIEEGQVLKIPLNN